MTQTTLAFYKGEGRLLDHVIRWWTASEFSHCEIVLSRKGSEAVLFSASARDGGVRKVKRKLVPERWEFVTVKGGMAPHILAAFIEAKTGARYDFAGLFFSQFLASGRQTKSRWFCSEICAYVLGLPEPQRYSPESLRKMVLFLNGGLRHEG